MSTDLADQIRTRVDALPAPPGDLDAVRRAGGRIRTRRRAAAGAGVAVLACAAVFALWPGGDQASTNRGVDPAGPPVPSQGLRAYADAKHVYLGGHTVPTGDLFNLDTSAVATPYGIVYFDRGQPALLSPSGEINGLEPNVDPDDGRPSVQVDSQNPWVAYRVVIDGKPHIVVHDFEHPDEPVATTEVPEGTEVEAIDDGVVVFWTPDGSRVWDTRSGDVADLGGPHTRIADVRNGVLLYDGPAPDGPAAAQFRMVPAGIEAQLTFDGQHVLYWSTTLESTGGGPSIVLDQEASFVAMDTDGSVLAAVSGKGDAATVYDCELSSGHCEEVGQMSTANGDPMFIGTDM